MTGLATDLLHQLLKRRTDNEAERTILRVLATVETEQLNEMLADPWLTDRLVGSMDDRWFGPDHHTELMSLLGVTRRAELGLPARAAFIHAVQTGRTDARDERIVAALFCDVKGADLTVLKSLVDATPNHNDLEELIYRDIDDQRVRDQILAHIAAEALHVNGLEAKVLSDIDDTTICSLHDKRYPKGVVYPGVLALWEALDQGPQGKPRSLGDLTFITARPADLLGWVEDQTRRKLRGAGVGVNSMLTGSLTHLLSHSGMADKKIQNITHYHHLYPEYRLVFIGDSGQGDVTVGERLRAEFSDAVDAVLIHDVVDTDAVTRARHASAGVVFFDTYVAAALEVRRIGLISDAGLQSVADATVEGFADVPWRDEAQEARARGLLQADLNRLDAERGQADPG